MQIPKENKKMQILKRNKQKNTDPERKYDKKCRSRRKIIQMLIPKENKTDADPERK